MAPILTGEKDLRRLFAGLIEQTFQSDFGVADPAMLDYLVDLLVRFVKMDAIYRVRNTEGRRLEEVAEMLLEAQERQARPQREVYRHIGDYTLFWSGVYPESLKKRQSAMKQDHFIDYQEQGKRSYFLASTFDDEPYQEEATVLRRLSSDFELCSFGLNRVRHEWEQSSPERFTQDEIGWN